MRPMPQNNRPMPPMQPQPPRPMNGEGPGPVIEPKLSEEYYETDEPEVEIESGETSRLPVMPKGVKMPTNNSMYKKAVQEQVAEEKEVEEKEEMPVESVSVEPGMRGVPVVANLIDGETSLKVILEKYKLTLDEFINLNPTDNIMLKAGTTFFTPK